MAEAGKLVEAMFRIVIAADIQRVWRELTKTDEAQGAVFNAWLHTSALVPGARMQMRTGSGKHVLVVGEVVECDPPHRFVHTHLDRGEGVACTPVPGHVVPGRGNPDVRHQLLVVAVQ